MPILKVIHSIDLSEEAPWTKRVESHVWLCGGHLNSILGNGSTFLCSAVLFVLSLELL